MKHRLLLVDDDELTLKMAQDFFEEHGYQVDAATNGLDAEALVSLRPHQYSLIIVDYRMEGRNGAETVGALTKINPDLFIMVYSGDPTREAVLKTTREGARSFVDKAEGLLALLREVGIWCRKFELTHLSLSDKIEESESAKLIESIGLIGTSKNLASLAQLVQKLKVRTGPVLILGESGTGKELVARALHNHKGLFKAINCATFASNPQLMASTLFGHCKGAFTGASSNKIGLLESVGDGTVFLDEVYAFPASCQLELLRALQEKVISPLGSTGVERPIHCRIVAAAKPTLPDMVKQGTFAADLYYRIGRTVLTIPPLRERIEDLASLVHFFCNKWSEENGEQKTFLARTLPFLETYDWPGNVRELENLVYGLLDITTEQKIAPEHLDAKFFARPEGRTTRPARHHKSLKQHLNTVEKEHVKEVLEYSTSLREAAKKMDTSLTTVLRLLKKHSIDPSKLIIKNYHHKSLS